MIKRQMLLKTLVKYTSNKYFILFQQKKNLTMHIQLSAEVVLTKSYFKRVTDILLYHLVFMLAS